MKLHGCVLKNLWTHFFFCQCITIPFFPVCYRKLYSNRKRYDSAFFCWGWWNGASGKERKKVVFKPKTVWLFFRRGDAMFRVAKRERSHNILMNSFPLRQQNHYLITTEMGGMVRLAKKERSLNILMNSYPLRQQNHYLITTVSINKLEET